MSRTLSALGRKYIQDLARDALNIDIPSIVTKDYIAKKLWEKNHRETAAMFEQLKALVLTANDIKPSTVFDMRSRRKDMFSGEQKNEQIPDAFILEMLKQDAKNNGPLILVSADGDFDAVTKYEPKIELIKTLQELLRMLKLEITETYIERFATVHADELIKFSQLALSDQGSALTPSDYYDAEIEDVSVSGFRVVSIDEFKTAEDELLVTGRAVVDAAVNYTREDYDNAIWDSEDKQYIGLETINGEAETEIEFDFSMTVKIDNQKLPSRITDFQLGDDKSIRFALERGDYY